MEVLLSLKPVYAEAILSGKKRYEFRRTIFKREGVNKAYIYATSPVGKVVGFFSIKRVLAGTPKRIWAKCRRYAGISADAFFKYYEGCERAFAIEIGAVKDFLNPLNPRSFLPDFRPPQSFYYVPASFEEGLIET